MKSIWIAFPTHWGIERGCNNPDGRWCSALNLLQVSPSSTYWAISLFIFLYQKCAFSITVHFYATELYVVWGDMRLLKYCLFNLGYVWHTQLGYIPEWSAVFNSELWMLAISFSSPMNLSLTSFFFPLFGTIHRVWQLMMLGCVRSFYERTQLPSFPTHSSGVYQRLGSPYVAWGFLTKSVRNHISLS
jgi:hypothetical protein